MFNRFYVEAKKVYESFPLSSEKYYVVRDTQNVNYAQHFQTKEQATQYCIAKNKWVW